MKRLLPFVLLLGFHYEAPAQNASTSAPLVLSCDDGWGADDHCGGCNNVTFQVPTGNILVKPTTPDFWAKLSSLQSSMGVAITTNSAIKAGAKMSASAACAAVTGTATAGSLLGAPPPPPPTTGTAQVIWTAPTTNTDGSQLTNLANYSIWRASCSACPCQQSTLTVVSTVGPTVLQFNDPNLTVGTAYTYSVTDTNTTGQQSAQPAGVCLVITSGTLTVAPNPPGGISVQQVPNATT